MQVGGGRGRGENHIPFAVRRDLFICFCHTIVTLRGFNNFFHRGMICGKCYRDRPEKMAVRQNQDTKASS